MKIRFGYVALSMTLDHVTSSSLLTYTHFKKIGKVRGYEKLRKLTLSNFEDLKKILHYNIRNDILFYRMTSNLIPLVTHPDVQVNLNEYREQFQEIGCILKEHHIRLDTHPDQFCVLNSDREEVFENTVRLLETQTRMYELMDYPGRIILHVGGKVGGKKAATQRFFENFARLDSRIQKRIVIENDDKVYNIRNVLKICETLHIPMVLDYHHYKCNNNGEQIEDYIERIFHTWGNEVPKIHFSSPKARNKKEKRSHHDYIDPDSFITFLERVKFVNRDFDVMIEAKMKDVALFHLIRLLKYKTDLKIEKNTIFLK